MCNKLESNYVFVQSGLNLPCFISRNSTPALFSILCRGEPIDCVLGLGEAVPEALGNIKVPHDVKITLSMLQPEKKKSPPSVSISVG